MVLAIMTLTQILQTGTEAARPFGSADRESVRSPCTCDDGHAVPFFWFPSASSDSD